METTAPELPITEPGVYSGVDMDDYHGQLTVGPSISGSGLNTITLKSLAHYYEGSYLNPKRTGKRTRALDFGSAAHALLLGDEVFEDRHSVRPFDEGANKNERGWSASEKKDWLADEAKRGRVVITREEYQTICRIRDALVRDPEIRAGILEGEVEQTLVTRDPATGVWIKGRPDTMPASGWFADLKLVANAHPDAVDKAIMDYRWGNKFALAARILADLRDRGHPVVVPNTFVVVAVEKEPPYLVTSRKLLWETIRWGEMENQTALLRFAAALKTGDWPGYDNDRQQRLRKWVIDDFQYREDHGLLEPPGAWVEDAREPA